MTGPNPTPPASVLVLGAGCAGLVAALDLVATGHDVTVVDKGRAVGGRLACRRVGEAVFDHGAQFATFKHDDVRDLVERWRRDGVLLPWFHGDPDADEDASDRGHPRFRGVPRMRSLAEHLAADLPDVRTGLRVAALAEREGLWLADAVPVDGGDPVELAAAAVVCTAPLPQTLALLDAGGVVLDAPLDAALRTVTYDPTLAVLAVPDGVPDLPNHGALRLADGAGVSWVADLQAKGTSAVPAVVVHGDPAVSRELWDADDARVADRLLSAARPNLGVDARAVRVHRWRYATPVGRPPGGDELTLTATSPAPIAFAGDAFAGGRVEGALRSGRAAAEALHRLLA